MMANNCHWQDLLHQPDLLTGQTTVNSDNSCNLDGKQMAASKYMVSAPCNCCLVADEGITTAQTATNHILNCTNRVQFSANKQSYYEALKLIDCSN